MPASRPGEAGRLDAGSRLTFHFRDESGWTVVETAQTAKQRGRASLSLPRFRGVEGPHGFATYREAVEAGRFSFRVPARESYGQ